MADAPIRVLLIDDDEDTYVITEGLLASVTRHKYELSWAETYEQGIDLIKSESHDAYLVDYLLGARDGMALLREAIAFGCQAPLMLLSAHVNDQLDEEAMQAGAADCLAKLRMSGLGLDKAIQHALERQRLVNALKESETLYHSLIDQLPVRVFRKDRDGTFTFVNKTWCDEKNVEASKVIGTSDFEYSPKELAEKYRADDQHVLTTGEDFHDIEPYMTDSGEHFVEVVKTPLRDHRGNIIGLQGALLDVTDRMRAQEALRNSEAMYHSLVENIPMCVWRKDLDGNFTFGNRQLCDELGTTPDEIVGKTDYDFSPSDLADKYLADDRAVIDTGQEFRTIEEHYDARHNKAYIEVLKSVVRDAKGNIIGTQGMYMNVTDRVVAEKQLKETAVALERTNEELQQFAYVASHDLQEPLRMIASYCQLLDDQYADKLDDDAKTFIHFALDGAQRMQVLIRDLLSFSRLDTQAEAFELVDCSDIMDVATRNLSVLIDETGAEITYDRMPAVQGDSSQLVQLFQNMIGNAIKFRGDRSPIVHVGVRRSRNRWMFSVEDNGIGIAPEEKDQIFLIFKRLHTREEYPGTGIGLAVCKKVVERHGGRMWVESEPGKGSTFFFKLRAAPAK